MVTVTLFFRPAGDGCCTTRSSHSTVVGDAWNYLGVLVWSLEKKTRNSVYKKWSAFLFKGNPTPGWGFKMNCQDPQKLQTRHCNIVWKMTLDPFLFSSPLFRAELSFEFWGGYPRPLHQNPRYSYYWHFGPWDTPKPSLRICFIRAGWKQSQQIFTWWGCHLNS